MKLRPPSRRRAFISTFGSRFLSLWRRWSAADWILDRMRDWKSAPKDRPMFPKARLDLEVLEMRAYLNEPFNLLQAPLLGSMSIVAADFFRQPLRASAKPVPTMPPLANVTP